MVDAGQQEMEDEVDPALSSLAVSVCVKCVHPCSLHLPAALCLSLVHLLVRPDSYGGGPEWGESWPGLCCRHTEWYDSLLCSLFRCSGHFDNSGSPDVGSHGSLVRLDLCLWLEECFVDHSHMKGELI